MATVYLALDLKHGRREPVPASHIVVIQNVQELVRRAQGARTP